MSFLNITKLCVSEHKKKSWLYNKFNKTSVVYMFCKGISEEKYFGANVYMITEKASSAEMSVYK